MIRNQEEIKVRFQKVSDLFGTQKNDLINYMTFDNAKTFLKEEYVKEVEAGTVKWVISTDPKKEILDYLDFAYNKAENERGLSAGRSMLHFKTWIWLDDNSFYGEIVDDIDNYTNYGIPTLNKIAKHYGFTRYK